MIIEQAQITQLMILQNIYEGRNKPSEIAKELGITLQGVQYHIRNMKKSGYINETNTISKEGFDFLYAGLSRIKDFVNENIVKLDYSLIWEAICDEDISTGDKVYLHMDKGYLHATKSEKYKSAGISQTAAKAGQIMGVSQIYGMIEFKLKDVTIIVLPDVELMESFENLQDRLSKELARLNTDLVAVLGEEAWAFAKTLDLKIDFEYAPLHSAFEAASRGMSTALITSDRRMHYMLSEIKDLENKNPQIKIRILHM